MSLTISIDTKPPPPRHSVCKRLFRFTLLTSSIVSLATLAWYLLNSSTIFPFPNTTTTETPATTTDEPALELNRQLLEQWYPNLTEFTDKLELNNRNIGSIDTNTFAGLKNLQYLDLSGNRLSGELEPNLFRDLVNVSSLYLSFNKFTSISSDAFVGLNSLESLFISFNEIKTLHSDCFKPLSKLRLLDTSGNQLTGDNLDPKIFTSLVNLFYLYLSNNPLVTFNPELFNMLNNLQLLDLSAIKINHLNKTTFVSSLNLKNLFLGQNQLPFIDPGTFLNLEKLESLDLGSNQLGSQLESASNLFNSLSSLKFLVLNENNIIGQLGEGLLNGLTSLEELDLKRNLLTAFRPDTFSDQVNLKLIDLKGNPWAEEVFDVTAFPGLNPNCTVVLREN